MMKKSRANKKDYRKLSKETKKLIRWQVLRLKSKGYKHVDVSRIVGVSASTVSTWWKVYKADNKKHTFDEQYIEDKLDKLTVEMKEVLSFQVCLLREDKNDDSQISKLLGVKNVDFILTELSDNQKKSKGKAKKRQSVKAVNKPKIILEKKKAHVKKKNNKEQKACKSYRQYSKRTQDLIRWQALRLKDKGYSFNKIAQIVNVHASTISLWWKSLSKENVALKKETVKNKFPKLSLEMKEVIVLEVLYLKSDKVKHVDIADILGLESGALVSRWLRAYHKDLELKQNKTVSDAQRKEPIKKREQQKTRAKDKLTKTSKLEVMPTRKLNKDFLDEKVQGESKLKKIDILKKRIERLEKLKQTHRKIQENSALQRKKLIKIAKKFKYKRSEQPFFQIQTEKEIHVDNKIKVIKANDYAHYVEANALLHASSKALSESKKTVATIQEQALKKAELLANEARKEALEEGEKEANEQLAIKNISATMNAEAYLSSLQETLPDIILSIVRKFIDNYDDTEFIIHTINSALKVLRNKQKVSIHINSDMMLAVKDRLAKISYPNEKITLVPDASLKEKDCLIITKLGVVNACLETQLQKIETEIKVA